MGRFQERKIDPGAGRFFRGLLLAIGRGGLLGITAHPNPAKYPRQNIYVVRMAGYIYLVPHEEIGGKIRMITIIPSRKALRKYRQGGGGHEA